LDTNVIQNYAESNPRTVSLTFKHIIRKLYDVLLEVKNRNLSVFNQLVVWAFGVWLSKML